MSTQKHKSKITEEIDRFIDYPEFVAVDDLVEWANKTGQDEQIWMYYFLRSQGIPVYHRAIERDHIAKTELYFR